MTLFWIEYMKLVPVLKCVVHVIYLHYTPRCTARHSTASQRASSPGAEKGCLRRVARRGDSDLGSLQGLLSVSRGADRSVHRFSDCGCFVESEQGILARASLGMLRQLHESGLGR